MIEDFRRAAVEAALSPTTAANSLHYWTKEVFRITNGKYNGTSLFNLGDNLKRIFLSSLQGKTREGGNPNSSVSSGGAAWESLVCWYLNLCLIGTKVVVVKSKKELLPTFVTDGITVKYNNFKSNTEADLIYIGFPDVPVWPEKEQAEKYSIYFDRLNNDVYSMGEIAIGIIQTKTNWNDNAQIPMLWDMVYSAEGFGRNVQVGSNGRAISSFKSFSYSFITVPTQKNTENNYKTGSIAVNRVRNISGGAYWGLSTKDGVCNSAKEFFGKNVLEYIPNRDHVAHLNSEYLKNKNNYSYFGLISNIV